MLSFPSEAILVNSVLQIETNSVLITIEMYVKMNCTDYKLTC